MKSFRWIKIGAMVLMSAGIALALTVPTFAKSRGALAKSEVKSSMILIKSGNLKPEVILKQHGTITVSPVSNGQWQATWTWQGLHNDMLPIILVGAEGTQVNGGTSNISSESAPTYSGDSVTIDFTPPSSYPAQPEVVQFISFGDDGKFDVSPVGQLPEVPWAAGLPIILLAPLAIKVMRRRM